MATQREIFDKVKAHLLEQNKVSEGWSDCERTTICLYRSPEGMKCAVGVLISDADYSYTMEGMGICDLVQQYPDKFDWDCETMRMLIELQSIHDTFTVGEWGNRLNKLETDTFGVVKTT